MTTPDLLRLLLLLLLGLLFISGEFLLEELKKPGRKPHHKFLLCLLIAVCVGMGAIASGLVATPPVDKTTYWFLGIGYAFALPTTGCLLKKKQSKDDGTSSSTAEAISQRWRQELLAIMLTDVKVRMEDSLHDDQLIPLLMEDRREEIGRPPEVTVNAKPSPGWWEKLPKFTRVTAKSEPGKKIIDVFEQDDIAGRLLILGAPGSGKTTMLLELAQDLILGAQQQPEKPIPVIFELSNWKDDKQPIADWLVADLKFRNNIPEAITREWIQTGKLLPLLDGLDELQSRQAKCIERINEFLQATSRLSQIVVCCREEEYKTGEEILTLRGAVCLKPLEEKQIQKYLKRLNCGYLWQGIKSDPDGLLVLAKMPLFLHLIPVAYPTGLESKAKHFDSPAELEVYQEKCRKDLLDAYIKRRLELPHDCQGYEPEDSNRWLIWLAKTLKEQKQTEFFIEKMQPIFLCETQNISLKKLIYIAFYNLIYLIISALLLGLATGAIYGMFGLFVYFNLIQALINGTIIGLFISFLYLMINGLYNDGISLANNLIITWGKSGPWLICGLSVGFLYGLHQNIEIINSLINGFILGLILVIMFGLTEEQIKNTSKPNQGIKESAKNTVIISLIGCPVGMLLYAGILVKNGHFVNPISTVIPGLICAFLFSIFSAGLPVIQHFALRLILWKSGVIPWNYARFLSYANERRLIKQVGGRYRFIHDLLREHFAKM